MQKQQTSSLPAVSSDGKALEFGMYVSRVGAGRLERYRDARESEWTRRNALRWALGREPHWTRIDLSDFVPFES